MYPPVGGSYRHCCAGGGAGGGRERSGCEAQGGLSAAPVRSSAGRSSAGHSCCAHGCCGSWGGGLCFPLSARWPRHHLPATGRANFGRKVPEPSLAPSLSCAKRMLCLLRRRCRTPRPRCRCCWAPARWPMLRSTCTPCWSLWACWAPSCSSTRSSRVREERARPAYWEGGRAGASLGGRLARSESGGRWRPQRLCCREEPAPAASLPAAFRAESPPI